MENKETSPKMEKVCGNQYPNEPCFYPHCLKNPGTMCSERPVKETSPTLPEELVRAHEGWMSDHKLHISKVKAAEITLDYMGRFAEWMETKRFFMSGGKWTINCDSYLSTPQLIQLFFDNQNK